MTDLFSRSLMYFSPNVPTSSKLMPTQTETNSIISASNPHGYGRSFFEMASRVNSFPRNRVVFEAHNEVQE
ncbi:hypothetical protein GCK32_021071, partial [Trichostrongylus colubriformis]